MFARRSKRPNRWKGALLGAAGGVAGTIVMAGYWKALTAMTGRDLRKARNPRQGSLGNIAVVPSPMEEGESSTETVGRIVYDNLAGISPRSRETRKLLSRLVHWAYGIVQGGIYGAVRGREKPPDLAGAGVFGTALWGVSEVGLPVLGLGKGPTAHPLEHHAASLGAHLVYGLTTASAVQLLRRWL